MQTKPEFDTEKPNDSSPPTTCLVKLIEAARNGDLDAFGNIVELFQKMAHAIAYAKLGDFHLAQDTAQEAFIEAYLNLPKLYEPAAFPGWFRKIIFKRADRLIRGKQATLLSLDLTPILEANDAGPLQQAETLETQSELHKAINHLPEAERIPIALFYLSGYSQAEITVFLELPLTTVKKRLYSGRQHLKERMHDWMEYNLNKPKPSLTGGFSRQVQFLLAARAGDVKKVQALLETDPQLVFATEEWDENLARQFYVPMSKGYTALWRAAYNGQLEMVDLLLAKTTGATSNLPLELAVLMEHSSIVERLIQAGADVNAQSKNGQTPLTISVIRENQALVKLLLAHGAKANAKNQGQRTSLTWAAIKGQQEIAGLLIEAGADPNLQDETGRTPLAWAQKNQHQVVVELLQPYSVQV